MSAPFQPEQENAAHPVLTGIGHYFPPNVLDNDFFDGLDIGSDAAWIYERVGIRERRSVLTRADILRLRRGETTRQALFAEGRIMTAAAMCREPWQMVQRRANAAARQVMVEQLIAGTSVPDWDIPANACAIAAATELECAAFDVNSACSSFVVGLHVARCLLQANAVKTAAIFTAERYTTRVDFSDRSSCVLFGDSATAALLEVSAGASGLELLDTVIHSSPSGFEHVRLPEGGFFSQNGKAVQKFAVTKTVSVTLELLERARLSPKNLNYFIGHQANYRMLISACQKLGLSEKQHLFNVDLKGNQGAAGAPAVLSENWERFRTGDYIAVAVVGSGLTWGAALFRKN